MLAWIIEILILGAATAIVMLLHGTHWSQWRSAVLLALAGVAAGFFIVVAKFEPVQRTVFPFRYEMGNTFFVGRQTLEPHDAPEWLLGLAERGQLVQENPDPGVEISYPQDQTLLYESFGPTDQNALL